jgi:queuine tRNA-ribosyltransferase
MQNFEFKIEKKLANSRARAGAYNTPHGVIKTPAFANVGTKATVKSLTPEMLNSIGTQVVLANTYHLYLEPGDEIISSAGGFAKFMNWNGPTMTDSGGFQVFSLGAAFGSNVSKIAKASDEKKDIVEEPRVSLAKISENGVTFKSHIDGSMHEFTPEKSMQIQYNLGADIIFAFDECTSPQASHEYQKEAMDRTHRWAKRSVIEHEKLDPANKQALFGVIQGGRFKDLREESARAISEMNFDGFGIGGSFDKDDMYSVVGWVNDILPENKPRHLLGIGEPGDLFGGIENGADFFDCVAPTRIARNGSLYSHDGMINIFNAKYREDFSPIEKDCKCYTCLNFTRAYLAHLFRSKEMLAATLASIHNLHFINDLISKIRESILNGDFFKLKEKFLSRYYKK